MGRLKRGFRGGWLLLVGLLGSLIAHAEAPVWALKGDRNTVYLAGSVHLLRAGDSKLPAAFDRAYADSAALVMEVDMDDLNPMADQGWLLQNGMYTAEGSLSNTIGKARFDKLQLESNRLGIPVVAIERFEPWFAALTLSQLQLVKLGFDPTQGVEMQLTGRAQADHKEVTGLETMTEQLAMLDGLKTEDQIRFLDLTIEEMHEVEQSVDELVGAWRTGNAKKLADLLGEEYTTSPALYTMLVSDRNRRWMPELQKLLKSDKNYLVVVGTLHLVGKGGLLELAKARGIEARQLP